MKTQHSQKLSNVKAIFTTGWKGEPSSLALTWEKGGAHYTVWLDTTAPFDLQKHGFGGDGSGNPVLYEHPPLPVKPTDPGYFPTRTHNPAEPDNASMIQTARSMVDFERELEAFYSGAQLRTARLATPTRPKNDLWIFLSGVRDWLLRRTRW